MRYIKKFSLLLFLLGVGTICFLLVWFTDTVSKAEYNDYRMNQLRGENFSSHGSIMQFGSEKEAFLNKYFESIDGGYRYKGGLMGRLQLDSIYKHGEIVDVSAEKDTSNRYVSFGWDEGEKIYINVDRIGEGSVKEFLKKLDSNETMGFRELWIDLRFIRELDFGIFLRLANQWCNKEDFELAKIVGKTRTDIVTASGNPFFSADKVYFLLSDDTPDEVKKVAVDLTQLQSYKALGNFSFPADTICVRTSFRSGGGKIVEVCNKLLVSGYNPQVKTNSQNESNIMNNWDVAASQFQDLYYNKSSSFSNEKLRELIGQLISKEN
ncbi:hypothetical protein [Membranihabitans maritimus]|uniref:hypothetical protein n=1 Tax=Membranihabitans maritimus TaxID=2904244 RepID=UPI001F288584|nr:hypothetical protein [Membranihabitans maritimus]